MHRVVTMPCFQTCNLQGAICLLALTTERPQELDTVVPGLRSCDADMDVNSTEEFDSLKNNANLKNEEEGTGEEGEGEHSNLKCSKIGT